MKKQKTISIFPFSFLLLLILISTKGFSQNTINLVNNGAQIVIKEGANVIIDGNYYNKNDGTFDGKINLDGNLVLSRNWVNLANNEVMTSAGVGPVGNVIMNGVIKQYIEGSHPTLFENLVLKNSKKLLGISNCKVNDTLVIAAILNLNTHRIKLLKSSPSAIKYVSNYILGETNSLEGLGEVEWYIGQDTDTYVVPFGSGYEATSDLSVTLSTKSPGSPSGGSIVFATYPTGCQNVPLPSVVYELDRSYEYIADRYWIIDALYDEKPETDLIFQYRTTDINEGCNGGLQESEIQAIRYNPIMRTWKDMAPRGYSNPGEHKFYIKGISPEDFYAPWCLVEDPMPWEIFFPNAFTPNGDGTNDFYAPVGLNLDQLDLKMYIYNRWGNLVYVMEDINSPWDGTTGKSDKICPEGIYAWILFLKDSEGMDHTYKGIVTLVH